MSPTVLLHLPQIPLVPINTHDSGSLRASQYFLLPPQSCKRLNSITPAAPFSKTLSYPLSRGSLQPRPSSSFWGCQFPRNHGPCSSRLWAAPMHANMSQKKFSSKPREKTMRFQDYLTCPISSLGGGTPGSRAPALSSDVTSSL